MSALTYENQALQWRPGSSSDRKFATIIALVITFALILSLLFSIIKVPQEPRQLRAAVPERIAKFILEKEKLKPQPKPDVAPPPKPIPKPEIKVEPPPEPEPILKPDEPEPVPQPKPQKPERTEVLTDAQQKARATAQKSGLLALGNELSDLMDTSDVSNMARAKISTTTGSSITVAGVNTSVLSAAGAGGGSSVKIKPSDYSTAVASTQLNQQERVKVASALVPEKNETTANGKTADAKKQKTTAGNGVRFEEDIYYVIDQNKGKLHAVYRQARRANPGLKGKIVFDITILASGQVSAVVIRSSELDDAALQERLISRLKSFDFGLREGGEMTVTYPIEFLP